MKTTNNNFDYKGLLNEIETLAMTPTFIVEAAKLAPKLGFTQKDWDIEKPYILLEQSTSYTIVGGREIPFYAEPEAVFKETTESYESAELACLKKLIEIVKNK